MLLDDYRKKIDAADLYDLVCKTDLSFAPQASKRFQNDIFIKREDLQQNFSFKIRGAYCKMLALSAVEKKRGVITASAGNHAQGVARAAQKLNLLATIYMPRTTPQIKVEAVAATGCAIVLHGDNYDETAQEALSVAKKEKKTYISPYDDKHIIIGQGTVGKEIVEQIKDIDCIFVPVGGGGLCAGVVAYVKSLYPHIKIYAVEPEDSACLHAALESGERTILERVGIFVDGASVCQIGEEPFHILREHIDGCILVNTDEICAAIKDIFEETRTIVEPAGALSFAGMKKYIYQENIQDKRLITINSGANINFDRLRYISERTEIGEQREVVLAVSIPEEVGSFLKFCHHISRFNITEFNYRYGREAEAHIYVGIQTKEGQSHAVIMDKVMQAGYSVVDMTHNELAKLHTRHMVGGRNSSAENERVYRFEFPERPGALLEFLQNISSQYNISMFHYRNHGAAFGRVFLGIQVPFNLIDNLEKSFNDLGYSWVDETENDAYRLFLT